MKSFCVSLPAVPALPIRLRDIPQPHTSTSHAAHQTPQEMPTACVLSRAYTHHTPKHRPHKAHTASSPGNACPLSLSSSHAHPCAIILCPIPHPQRGARASRSARGRTYAPYASLGTRGTPSPDASPSSRPASCASRRGRCCSSSAARRGDARLARPRGARRPLLAGASLVRLAQKVREGRR